MTQQKSSATETFVIEGVVLSFPHLFALDNNGKYSASLLFSEQIAGMIYQKAQGLATGHFVNGESALPQFRWPVGKAADKMNSTGAFTYKDNPRLAALWVGSSSAQEDRQPAVVDENRQPVLDRGKIYAGCMVAVGIRLFTYNTKGNIGVGIGLQAIMKTGEGEPLGGDSSVDANALFGNVQAQAPVAHQGGGGMPNGAPAPVPGAPQPTFGAPTAPAAAGMPAAPFPGQQPVQQLPGGQAGAATAPVGVPGLPGLPGQ